MARARGGHGGRQQAEQAGGGQEEGEGGGPRRGRGAVRGAERGGPERSGEARPGPAALRGAPAVEAARGGRACAAALPALCVCRALCLLDLFYISLFPLSSSFSFLFPLLFPFFPPRGAVRPAPSQRDARLCQSQTNGKVPRSSSGFHFEILPRILFVPVLFTLTWKRSPALHGRSQGRRKRRPRSARTAGIWSIGTPGGSEPPRGETDFKSASIADRSSRRPAVPRAVRYLEGRPSPSSALPVFSLHLNIRRRFSSLCSVLSFFVPYCC